jgi:hypothetical protein
MNIAIMTRACIALMLIFCTFETSARYVQSDPIGLSGGLNTFGYVGQRPTVGIDPKGLAGCYYTIGGGLYCAPNGGGPVIGIPADGVHSGLDGCRNNASCVDKKDKGPIPPGCYRVAPHESTPNFYRLIPVGWGPSDGAMCRLGWIRCGFELHPGRISSGCVTVDKSNGFAMGAYGQIESMLSKDAPDNILCVGTQ